MIPNTYLFNKMFEIHIQHSHNQMNLFLKHFIPNVIRKRY